MRRQGMGGDVYLIAYVKVDNGHELDFVYTEMKNHKFRIWEQLSTQTELLLRNSITFKLTWACNTFPDGFFFFK